MEDRMTPTEYATWTRRRKLGRWRYVIRYGFLSKGALLIGGFAFALRWAGVLRTGTNSWRDGVLDALQVAVIYGGIVGWLDYSNNEGRYAEGAESDDPEAAVECLNCGEVIPANEHRCPTCGWSFEDEGVKTPDRHGDTSVPPREDL